MDFGQPNVEIGWKMVSSQLLFLAPCACIHKCIVNAEIPIIVLYSDCVIVIEEPVILDMCVL